jgi:hypothetical protein
MKDLNAPDEELILETISGLSSQIYSNDQVKVSYADYQHSCFLLEMIDDLEEQLEDVRKHC